MPPKNLLELYRSRLDGLRAFASSMDENDDCDGPFVMAEPSSDFSRSRHRLLVVGQETNGWIGYVCGGSESDLDHNLDTYRQFNFGEKYSNIFFRYTNELAEDLVGSNLWMWSNLFKFGKASGKGAPSAKINELELEHFDVLREEIRLINPTCVVFMTGPNYDHFLCQRIPDATFSEMGDFNLRQMARVASSSLPQASYRIYHPGYGNRDVPMYRRTLDLIREDYRGREQG